MTSLAFVLAAALLGQNIGQNSEGQVVEIQKIVPKFKFEAFPGNPLTAIVASTTYDAAVYLNIPTGQSLTYLGCFDDVTDKGAASAFKIPYDQDLVGGSTSYVDWVPTTTGAGNIRLETQCYRANVGQALTIESLVGTTISGPFTANQMYRATLGVFPIADLDLNGMRLCATYRDVDHVDDTYTGALCVLGLVVAYERPVLGNTSTFTR